jgi:hypothetical protein
VCGVGAFEQSSKANKAKMAQRTARPCRECRPRMTILEGNRRAFELTVFIKSNH